MPRSRLEAAPTRVRWLADQFTWNSEEIEGALIQRGRHIVMVLPRRPHARNLRKARYVRRGLFYFLTTTAANRRKIFTRHERAIIVLDSIRWLNRSGRFAVDAAVVMPDHVHLAGRLGERSLSSIMHTLKSYTSNQLVDLGVDAPVWQPGYHDHVLRDDEDYAVRVRYLVNNPIRAGLVERIEDYPFCILPTWW